MREQVDALGNKTSFKCDKKGNVTEQTDTNLSVTKISYNKNDLIIKKKIPIEKDLSGNVVYVIETYQYDKMNNLIKQSITGSKETIAREVVYIYYKNNKVKSATDSVGGQITYNYDKNGNLTETKKVREGNDYDIEQFLYDSENRVIESIKILDEKDIYNSSTSPQIKITYEYDQLGRLIKQTDENGIETTYTYDELGRINVVVKHQEIKDLTISYQYDKVGNKIEEIDQKGTVTTYTYDNMNRIKTITKEGTFTYTYDLPGNIIKEINPKGNSITYTYDEVGRLKTTIDTYGVTVEERTYDNKGNVIAVKGAKINQATFAYDLLGRQIKAITKEGNETTYSYNAYGEVIAQANSLGETTTYVYDAGGRLIKVTDPEGVSVSYDYDKAGNKSYMVDGRGKITRYTYGAFSLLRQVTDAEGKTIKYLYNESGNIAQVEDKNNNHTMYLYNKNNQLIEKTVVETSDSIKYTYDAVGNKITMTDESGNTTYTYDAYNRLLTKKNNQGLNLTYTYDVLGNIASITDSKGNGTTYTYDKVERMATVTSKSGTTTYTYDKNGNRSSITYEGGVKETYEYNKDDKLIKLTNTKPDKSELSTYSYTYDKAGREISKTDSYGTTLYTYDKAGRIKQLAAPGYITTYVYDKAGNRISMEKTHKSLQESNYIDSTTKEKVKYKKIVTQYTYDNANHLLKQVELMYDDNENEILKKTTTYLYDNNGNELNEWSNYIKPHKYTMGQTTSGNIVTEGSSSNDSTINILIERRNSKYDGFNRLKTVEDLKAGERKLITYTYDGDDLRVQKEVRNSKEGYKSEVINYHYDRQHVILETDETGAEKVAYTRGLNYIARTEQGESNYYLYNGHGDVIQTVTKEGTVKNQYDYDIFGEPILVLEEGYENSIRYAGEFYDAETGLYYLRARYYNPETGRFISEDSYWGEDANPLSLNLYTYCYNDPINFIDPTGHWGGKAGESDDTQLSTEAQNQIKKLTDDYFATDSADEKEAIHQAANKVREMDQNKSSDNADSFGKAANDKVKTNRETKNQSYLSNDDWKELSKEYDRISKGEGENWSEHEDWTEKDINGNLTVSSKRKEQIEERAKYSDYEFGSSSHIEVLGIIAETLGQDSLLTQYFNDLDIYLESLPETETIHQEFRFASNNALPWWESNLNYDLNLGESDVYVPSFYDILTGPPSEEKSLLLSFIPVLEGAKDLQEALTGYDLAANKKLTIHQQNLALMALFVPFVGGKGLAKSADGLASLTDEIEDAITSLPKKTKGMGGTGSLTFKTGKDGERYLAELVGGDSQVYFKTSQGGRYIDQLSDGIAYESKVGYTSLTEFVRKQVLKDAELIKTGQINGAQWNFFTSDVTGKIGASKQLLEFLEQNGIKYVIHK